MTPTSTTPYEVVCRFLAAGKAGDADTIMTVLHPDLVCREADAVPFYGGEHRGPTAFLTDVLGPMKAAYEMRFHHIHVFDAGDTAIGSIDLEFVSHSSGRTIRMPVLEIYHVKDGLINEIDVYYKDTAALAEAFPEGLRRAGADA